MKELKPKKGAIAICRHGEIGLIESNEPNKNGIWFGKNILKPRNWQSKHPVVISHMCSESSQD